MAISMGMARSSQVDDCIAKFEWMAQMTQQMAAMKRAGKPMPASIDEIEAKLGERPSQCTR